MKRCDKLGQDGGARRNPEACVAMEREKKKRSAGEGRVGFRIKETKPITRDHDGKIRRSTEEKLLEPTCQTTFDR